MQQPEIVQYLYLHINHVNVCSIHFHHVHSPLLGVRSSLSETRFGLKAAPALIISCDHISGKMLKSLNSRDRHNSITYRQN